MEMAHTQGESPATTDEMTVLPTYNFEDTENFYHVEDGLLQMTAVIARHTTYANF